jgi:hypothetical protein
MVKLMSSNAADVFMLHGYTSMVLGFFIGIIFVLIILLLILLSMFFKGADT